MSIECPNISDKARLTLKQAREALGVKDNRTVKHYAALLNIAPHKRLVDGKTFYMGKDIKRIWLRIA